MSRMTDSTREVMYLAGQRAQAQDRENIQLSDILVAAMSDSVVACVFANRGFISRDVEDCVASVEESSPSHMGTICMSEGVKRVLDHAESIAKKRDEKISPGDLLLAMTQIASQVKDILFGKFGLSPEEVQKELAALGGNVGSLMDATISRMTDRMKEVVARAFGAALSRNSSCVNPSDLWRGLVNAEGGLARKILHRQELKDPYLLSDSPQELDGFMSNNSATLVDIGLSEESKRVIELSYLHAESIGNNYLGTEHLLLGLLAGQSRFRQIMEEKGMSLSRAKEILVGLQS